MRRIKAGLLLLAFWAASAAVANEAPAPREVARHAERLLERAYPDAQGPGAAVLVARGDEILFRGARGMASIELDVPLSPGQVFRLGSITKQIAAAGVLKLVEERKLSLDDPLARFLPDYPGAEAISVRMLLDHTSGIRSYTDVPGVTDGPIQRDLDTAQLVASFSGEPVDFAPGEQWRYNNSGYVLAGAVIEQASGEPWHAYLHRTLFEPLGMERTGYGNEAVAVIPGHVRGYTRVEGRTAVARYLSMTQPHAAGALVSTVDDMLRWNRAVHGGRALHRDSHRELVALAGKAGEENYGLGIVVGQLRGRTVYEHGGGIFGFSTYLMYLPQDELTVVVLQNTDSGTEGFHPAPLARRMAAFALGEPYPEAVAIEVDPAALAQAEGVYRIDEEAVRVLRVVDGALTSQRTGGRRWTLVPIAPDDFVFEDSLTRMTLERDAEGKVVAMLFQADGDGPPERVERSDEPLPEDEARPRIELSQAAREAVAGRYRAAAVGLGLRVFADGDRLMAQLDGQPAIEVFAESERVFYPTVVEATLEFAPAQGQAESVVLRQSGQEIVFERED